MHSSPTSAPGDLPRFLASTDSSGRCLLSAAAGGGDVATLTVLLRAGAVVNATDGNRHTPLYWACVGNRVEAAACLVRHGACLEGDSRSGSGRNGGAGTVVDRLKSIQDRVYIQVPMLCVHDCAVGSD